MPRKPRIEYPGAFYHVFTRGNNKQRIFRYDEDRAEFLRKLGEYKERYSFVLYAYTLMPNHFHLLVETREIPLSRIMQGLLQSYTQWHNRKYRVVGHLFQGRYKAIVCDKHAYLLILVRYLHRNCIRAGLVKDPSKYQWSSHRAYLGLDRNDLVNTEFVLSQFANNKKKALQLYNEFIMEPMNKADLIRLFDLVDQQFLGEIDFALEAQERAHGNASGSRNLIRNKPVDEIVKAVTELTGICVEDVLSNKRGKGFVEARGLLIHLCTKYSSLKRKEIARYLGRDAGSLVKIEKRLNVETLNGYIEELGW